MKKFKNKNTGEVVTEFNELYCKDNGGHTIPRRFIEGSCNWEEVTESNYQILSFSFPRQWEGRIATIQPNGKYGTTLGGCSWALNSLLNVGACVKTGDIKIHSVKRLSDGEVFTLGDLAKDGKYGYVDIIKELRVSRDGKSIYVSTENLSWGQLIEDIDKVKPLFLTEDGVEVFEGTSYFCVNTAPHLWSLFEQTAKERTQLNKGVKAFSTKELAEEFLLMSKPLLSLNDLLTVWSNERNDDFYSVVPLFKSFKRVAKSKLN
jgi:hypothetical protein